MPLSILDRFGRPLRSLRVSVTDRCNLRCQYCMPEPDYAWLPRETLLTFEETTTIIQAFTALGADRVRITGGEPLLRRNLPALIRQVAALPAVRDLAITTNGVLLADQAVALREAGLHRITVSLDTLHRTRFEALTRFDAHAAVLAGIDAASRAGYASLKIDSVIMRGVNDDELIDLIEYGRTVGAEVRFIEYMDVGGATRWHRDAVVSQEEMLAAISAHYGAVSPAGGRGSAPADRFVLPDGTTFGIIASTTEPFCAECDRSRLTADGVWLMCLYARAGTDLRRPLRAGATEDDLVQLIRTVWSQRADRGAEERLALGRREPLIPLAALKKDAHLEMHTRGG
jgi:GTP 3',8-cyclase